MNFDVESLRALLTQIESLLASTNSEIESLNAKLQTVTDYSSSDYIDSNKRISVLEEQKSKVERLEKLVKNYQDSLILVNTADLDADMRSLAEEDLISTQNEALPLYEEIFTKKSKHQNVLMEIRAGAGGDEAGLFARDLYKMYSIFATNKGWTVEVTDIEGSLNEGFRYVSCYIKGDGAYELLQFESGVHRVQRVPATESAGRIHTSTASVAILPEVEDVDIHIDPKDIEMETYRSSGPGGQHVNKTSSAVRLRHIPSGIIVTCQENRSQLKNRENAMRTLRSRLYQQIYEEQHKEMSAMRKQQIGSAERSEKIRTYNYPQSRITDHRIKKSWFSLTAIMGGDIEQMLEDVKEGMNNLDSIDQTSSDDDE